MANTDTTTPGTDDAVEPGVLTIEVEGATLKWPLSEHTAYYYSALPPDEQESCHNALAGDLATLLDHYGEMISRVAMSIGVERALENAGFGIEVIGLAGMTRALENAGFSVVVVDLAETALF